MTPKPFLPVLICLMLVLFAPVSALTITAESVGSYSVAAEDGMVIYQITINELPIGTNQTHTLVSAGNVYLLSIETYDEYGWKNADITLQTPNGSTQTAHVSSLGLMINSYKTTIQYVYPQAYSGTGMLAVHLTVGLTPASAAFNAGAMGWDPSNSLAFSAASGNLGGGTTTVYVEEMTGEDFANHVTNYDPVYGLGNLGGQVFQWTWNAVLGFISMIPVIGPIMVRMIQVMGGVLGTGLFWFIFVVANFPAILAGVETLIIIMALINAGKGKNSFSKLAGNIYRYNVEFVRGILTLVDLVWSWGKSAVEMITSIVNALKPI